LSPTGVQNTIVLQINKIRTIISNNQRILLMNLVGISLGYIKHPNVAQWNKMRYAGFLLIKTPVAFFFCTVDTQ
jgi:hypothetical protein